MPTYSLISVSRIGFALGSLSVLIGAAGCEGPLSQTPSPALRTAIVEITATPDYSEDGHALLRASQDVVSLTSAFSLRVHQVNHVSSDPPLTYESEAVYSVLNDRMQPFSATITTSTGTLEVICALAATARQCWAAVPGFPWSRDNAYDTLRWFDDPGAVFDRMPVSVTRLTSPGHPYAVTVSQQGGGFQSQGTTLIDAETLLPLSQHAESRTMDGELVSEYDIDYLSFNEPVEVRLPTPLTPTAIPSLAPIPDQYETVQEKAPTPGLLYRPVGAGPFPAVIVLHGSEGGLEGSGPLGERLARAGYMAYVLCYFGCEGTPSTLTGIEVERVSEAVDALKARADVRPDAIAVIGTSRGAEYALVAGALDPDIHAVVSIMGSSVVTGSLAGNFADSRKPAWVFGGKRVPFVTIPVEDINGPVLLLHAENDETWPVTRSYELAARLESFQHAYALTVFPSRGHSLSATVPGVMNAIADFLDKAFR